MRPGLVAIGVSLLVLAVATIGAVYLLPGTAPTNRDTNNVNPQTVAAHASGHFLLYGTESSSGTFSLKWQSTVPLDVGLWAAPVCPNGPASCAPPARIGGWTAATSGNSSWTLALHYPMTLEWTNNGSSSGTFEASSVATTSGSGALPALTILLIGVTVASVGVVGAVALFLGLFLRGNVYGPPPPLISRSADDVHGLDWDPDVEDEETTPITGPRTVPSDDEDEPPRPAPRAPPR